MYPPSEVCRRQFKKSLLVPPKDRCHCTCGGVSALAKENVSAVPNRRIRTPRGSRWRGDFMILLLTHRRRVFASLRSLCWHGVEVPDATVISVFSVQPPKSNQIRPNFAKGAIAMQTH